GGEGRAQDRPEASKDAEAAISHTVPGQAGGGGKPHDGPGRAGSRRGCPGRPRGDECVLANPGRPGRGCPKGRPCPPAETPEPLKRRPGKSHREGNGRKRDGSREGAELV